MIIRGVQPSDASEWLRLRQALWPYSTPEKEASEIDHFFASAESGVSVDIILAKSEQAA